MHNSICIDIKGNLDLGHSSRSRGNSLKIELAQHLVIGDHFSLSLEDSDGDSGLVICGCGVDLALFGRDGGVPIDHPSEDSS